MRSGTSRTLLPQAVASVVKRSVAAVRRTRSLGECRSIQESAGQRADHRHWDPNSADLFPNGKRQGTAVQTAVSPSRAEPWVPKSSALLACSKTPSWRALRVPHIATIIAASRTPRLAPYRHPPSGVRSVIVGLAARPRHRATPDALPLLPSLALHLFVGFYPGSASGISGPYWPWASAQATNSSRVRPPPRRTNSTASSSIRPSV
jgi:hypothetical protein